MSNKAQTRRATSLSACAIFAQTACTAFGGGKASTLAVLMCCSPFSVTASQTPADLMGMSSNDSELLPRHPSAMSHSSASSSSSGINTCATVAAVPIFSSILWEAPWAKDVAPSDCRDGSGKSGSKLVFHISGCFKTCLVFRECTSDGGLRKPIACRKRDKLEGSLRFPLAGESVPAAADDCAPRRAAEI